MPAPDSENYCQPLLHLMRHFRITFSLHEGELNLNQIQQSRGRHAATLIRGLNVMSQLGMLSDVKIAQQNFEHMIQEGGKYAEILVTGLELLIALNIMSTPQIAQANFNCLSIRFWGAGHAEFIISILQKLREWGMIRNSNDAQEKLNAISQSSGEHAEYINEVLILLTQMNIMQTHEQRESNFSPLLENNGEDALWISMLLKLFLRYELMRSPEQAQLNFNDIVRFVTQSSQIEIDIHLFQNESEEVWRNSQQEDEQLRRLSLQNYVNSVFDFDDELELSEDTNSQSETFSLSNYSNAGLMFQSSRERQNSLSVESCLSSSPSSRCSSPT